MSTKEEMKPENLIVDSIKKENAPSAFIVLPKPPHLSDGGERSLTALDLRTGTARKRSFPGVVTEADGAPKNKIPKRKPTDQELALNYFIKQLAHELLDRRLTIMQQPRHRLAQLEAACRRQFPAFNERQIRLKIRGQLKLYRRNLKKAEERKLIKPSQLIQQSGQIESFPLTQLSSNSNAISMAHRALANERKRVKAPLETSQDVMPLKALSDWQIVNANPTPIMISKPLTTNRSTSESHQLNQTWPPPISNPSLDASACIIASCLRLAANFLLQSATLFETKNPTMLGLNPPIAPLITSTISGSNLPPIPPSLGTSAEPFTLVCSTPSTVPIQTTSTTGVLTATSANPSATKSSS